MKSLFLTIGFFLFYTGYCQTIGELYEKSKEAVVLIKTSESEVVGQGFQQLLLNVKGLGSGFVVSKDGEIITASHVVQTAENIVVKFSDGEEVFAKVMHSYPPADVALIKLLSKKSTPLTVVKLTNSNQAKIGDQIFIIGAPFGLGHSLSVGYISGKYSRQLEGSFIDSEFIQTDAAINEGSSGAPMFNSKGEVIGIASFILSNSKGFQGLGFATTSNVAQKLLFEEQSVWTGLDAHFITGTLAGILNIPQEGGILIQKVAAYSLGDFMGLKGGTYRITIEGQDFLVGGDILLSVDSIKLIKEENLHMAWRYIQNLKPGETLKFKILRRGVIIEMVQTIPNSYLN